MADQNNAPMSEEDQFEQAVQQGREAGVLRPDPAEKKLDAGAAKPGEQQPHADTRAPAGDGQGGDGGAPQQRQRGADGRFAPKPPPFEGYADLPEHARQFIERLQTDVVREQNRARDAQRRLAQVQPTPRPSQAPAPRNPQQQPPAPAPQQPQPRDTKRWDEAAKGEHREFYETLEERILAGETEAGRKLTDLERKTAELDQKLQEVAAIGRRFTEREAAEHVQASRAIMADLSPNWQRTAGWIDANGNPVPREQQTFAPEFVAWFGAHSEQERRIMMEALDSRDPYVSGRVFRDFDRDYALAMLTSGQQPGPGTDGGRATPPPVPRPVPQTRRAQALNDVQPRPGGQQPPPREPARAPNPGSRDAEEAAFVAATTPDNMRVWRGHRA